MILTIAWPAVIALAVLMVAIALERSRGASPLPLAFVLLCTPSLVLPVWATATYGSRPTDLPAGSWTLSEIVLTTLALATPALTIAFVVIYRRARRVRLLVPAGIAATLLNAVAWFIGAMAIADDWI
jgi:hypothetical protein